MSTECQPSHFELWLVLVCPIGLWLPSCTPHSGAATTASQTLDLYVDHHEFGLWACSGQNLSAYKYNIQAVIKLRDGQQECCVRNRSGQILSTYGLHVQKHNFCKY